MYWQSILAFKCSLIITTKKSDVGREVCAMNILKIIINNFETIIQHKIVYSLWSFNNTEHLYIHIYQNHVKSYKLKFIIKTLTFDIINRQFVITFLT